MNKKFVYLFIFKICRIGTNFVWNGQIFVPFQFKSINYITIYKTTSDFFKAWCNFKFDRWAWLMHYCWKGTKICPFQTKFVPIRQILKRDKNLFIKWFFCNLCCNSWRYLVELIVVPNNYKKVQSTLNCWVDNTEYFLISIFFVCIKF